MKYGLYIHIPFCVKKCSYCDFVSFVGCEELYDLYVDSLIKEMQKYKGKKIETIYIGGGTPTVLGHKRLFCIIEAINDKFVVEQGAEFTIEANPKTITNDIIAMLKNTNVNRISIGVQSFNDSELSFLGRIHNANDAIETVKKVVQEGFNTNVDLMFALPNQTIESTKKNLEIAVGLGTKHISCYSLIIEEGTPLEKAYSKGEFNLLSDELDRQMYYNACSFLEENNFKQYEISNFAKLNYESKHNIKYWQCDEYIGIGLSAHSYIDGFRYSNGNNLNEYMKKEYNIVDKQLLTQKDKIGEFMIMGLRMTFGVSTKEFFKRFNVDILNVFGEEISRLTKQGLIKHENDRYCLTKKGVDLSNSVMCNFV